LLRSFILWGARPQDLFGVDLIEERILRGKQLLPTGATLRCGDAVKLDFKDESFDLVAQFTMFTSIFSIEVKRRIASEMLRVLKPGRHIVWYDFFVNNPFNAAVRGIRKGEIENLFAGCPIYFERLTMAAPLARGLGRISPMLCELLLRIGPFSTHYLAFIEKPWAYRVAGVQKNGGSQL
jgi:ubiquinone/menaquinone biosynthesis C-methylase UbiE